MTQHTGNCLLVIVLCTMNCRRLLVESEGFITLVCSFTIPKSTNVKPYATLCTAVPSSCFATQAPQGTPTRGSKRYISIHLNPSSLHFLASHIISVLSFPLWSHCNLTPLRHCPVCLCDLGFTLLSHPSLRFPINSFNHTTFLADTLHT